MAYLRRVAREPANHILNGFCQVGALLLHTHQVVIQLLTPAQHAEVTENTLVSLDLHSISFYSLLNRIC